MEGDKIFRSLTCCFIVILLMSWTINMNAQTKPTINRKSTPSATNTTTNNKKNYKKKSSSKKTTNRSKPKTVTAKNNSPKKISKENAYFDIVGGKYSVTFEANGGTEYFNISTNTSWGIETETYSWGHLYRKGNTLTLIVDPNNNYVSRSDNFVIANEYEYIEVSIYQKARQSTTLSISSDNLFFNATGGTQTITVYSNDDWRIGTAPNSWGHIRKNGNQLTFTVDPNTNHASRTDYFTIVAGDKNLRINITQDKKESSLWLSNDEIYVSSSGDTKYITVDSDGEYWEIGTNTNSWGHLSKSGNTLTLKIDPNKSSSTRTDYFTVKSGNKTKRVDITQYGAPSSSSSYQSSSYNSYSNNNYSNNSYSYNSNYQYNYNKESWWKGRVSVGVELVGSIYGGSNFSDLLFYSYGAGLVLRFGKFSDVLNFSTGCKWMRLGYDYEGYTGNYGNHIVVPGNLKFNLFYMGASKFYLGGGFEYGFGLKKMPDFMDWNAGFGVNSRHVDWYLFYKQFLKCKNIELFDDVYKHHIGTSITIYF